MNLFYISFTDAGEGLAKALAAALGGEADRCGQPMGLRQWTAEHFVTGAGLVFVGAAGIALRAIAPYVADKAADPAVVVIDERGQFAVPILSGHLGGANELAERIAAVTGGQAVITTATDVNGVFAADDWARRNWCAVHNKDMIKAAAKRALDGEKVRIKSDYPIMGEQPNGVEIVSDNYDISLSVLDDGSDCLHLVPKIVTIGIGCRKGTEADTIQGVFEEFLHETGLFREAIVNAATIVLKQNEAGLLAFCQAESLPLTFYSADELRAVPGDFTASSFVESVTGVDNVCERAAAAASGGSVILRKFARRGVTIAAAAGPYSPEWS